MMMRSVWFVSGLLLSAAVIASVLLTPAAAKRKPPPPPPPPPPSSTTDTYVKNYASVIDGQKCSLTPEAVQSASDGGSALLALSSGAGLYSSEFCGGASWVAKLDSFGRPQWQEVVGCITPPPPGSYAYGVALEHTTDGGYVLAGGARDCEFNPVCTYLTSIQCGLVQKLDATGKLVWSRAYAATPRETSFQDIAQTSDGGFVVGGSFRDAESNSGGLVVKLDGQGIAQWQTMIGPAGRTNAYFYAVRPTTDGGYVAIGELAPPTTCSYAHGCGQGVLVVKLDANGNVTWQRAFNSFDSNGAPTASEHALDGIQTSDGGFLIAGNWGNPPAEGSCCRGALLLKLDANGSSQWQKAYSGGVHCFSTGKTTCTAIGATIYSLVETADGGYSLGGFGQLLGATGVPLVPWLAKTDANGTLLWQHFYYPASGAQYFASSDVTSTGGHVAVGFTTNPTDYVGELFAVKTDSAGLVGGCSQVKPATPLNVVDPALATIAPGLPVRTTSMAQGDLPGSARPTSIAYTPGQC